MSNTKKRILKIHEESEVRIAKMEDDAEERIYAAEERADEAERQRDKALDDKTEALDKLEKNEAVRELALAIIRIQADCPDNDVSRLANDFLDRYQGNSRIEELSARHGF